MKPSFAELSVGNSSGGEQQLSKPLESDERSVCDRKYLLGLLRSYKPTP